MERYEFIDSLGLSEQLNELGIENNVIDDLTIEIMEVTDEVKELVELRKFVSPKGIKYEKNQEFQDELLKEVLRKKREDVCFSIVNRGQVWYETLTVEQKIDLQNWYKEWLDVTNTLIEPLRPQWL